MSYEHHVGLLHVGQRQRATRRIESRTTRSKRESTLVRARSSLPVPRSLALTGRQVGTVLLKSSVSLVHWTDTDAIPPVFRQSNKLDFAPTDRDASHHGRRRRRRRRVELGNGKRHAETVWPVDVEWLGLRRRDGRGELPLVASGKGRASRGHLDNFTTVSYFPSMSRKAKHVNEMNYT